MERLYNYEGAVDSDSAIIKFIKNKLTTAVQDICRIVVEDYGVCPIDTEMFCHSEIVRLFLEYKMSKETRENRNPSARWGADKRVGYNPYPDPVYDMGRPKPTTPATSPRLIKESESKPIDLRLRCSRCGKLLNRLAIQPRLCRDCANERVADDIKQMRKAEYTKPGVRILDSISTICSACGKEISTFTSFANDGLCDACFDREQAMLEEYMRVQDEKRKNREENRLGQNG